MDADYWHDVWARGDIKFHQEDFNPLMMRHFGALGLQPGDSVFVPLCGKTRDIAWLLGQGYCVVGCELNAAAVQALFADLGLTPEITHVGEVIRYAVDGLTVYGGDIFALDAGMVGVVDAVYDRAALVALPEDLRARYVDHIVDVSEAAPQCLITFNYDQNQMAGPPFAISPEMVDGSYGETFDVTCAEVLTIPPPGLKGKVPADEALWILRTKG